MPGPPDMKELYRSIEMLARTGALDVLRECAYEVAIEWWQCREQDGPRHCRLWTFEDWPARLIGPRREMKG